MSVLLNCGAVFLHVPKTGGSWVDKVLDELGLVKLRFSHVHADMERVQNYQRHYVGNYLKDCLKYKCDIQQEINSSYKFCFVREPLSWYESYWRFQMGHDWKVWRQKIPQRLFFQNINWHPWNVIENVGDANFDKYLSNILTVRPGYVSEMYNWYATSDIDFVGKQERLTDDLIEVLRIVGAKFDPDKIVRFRKVNESKSEFAKPIWDDGIKELFQKMEYSGRYRFGYIDR